MIRRGAFGVCELLDRVVGWCFWPYKKLDATSCVVSIDEPADWDAVAAFADSPHTTSEEVRKNRPPRDKIERALAAYLEAVKLANCKVNEGYLKALGLRRVD
ncbi:MAG TPA: hypothetical protein VNZ44_15840 [Pyrinomonadaceae bacterium]|nr:hypothetical protein [Pyrinomonadaceae bacterium]